MVGTGQQTHQMPKAGPTLRSELDGTWYLEAHPEVADFFKQIGVFSYCEKLADFHQQLSEAFALSYDGRTTTIGKEEFVVDEAAITEVTGLPRTGECWFKTTVPANIEFRSYLQPQHKDLIWKKDIPMSFLEPKWQALLKAIFAYITCEGRYNRVMFYHFKLLNHFTGRSPINLPFYLHKALTKMARQVKAKPTKVASRLSHQGLITLIVKESLKKKQVDWNYFLFWNEFQTNFQQDEKGKKSAAKKSITPKSSRRKRKAISPPREPTESSSAKRKRTKRKLQFGKEGEQTKDLAEGDNPLNLPYSDSEPEQELAETQGDEQAEQVAEDYPNLPSPTPPDEHSQPLAKASSSKPKASKTQKINKLLKQIYEMEVLERVIKKENTELTERNAELYNMNQSLKEKHDKIKDRNRVLIRENMKLYRQLRLLRLKLKESQPPTQDQTGLETLAELATTMVDIPQSSTQQIKAPRSVRGRAASSKRP
jgi:hypothetical protein